MKMADVAEKLILEWVKKEPVDILDRDFVDAFIAATGSAFNPMPFGAHKCGYLNRTLNRMSKEKKLSRFTIGLPLMEVGFPKWVYTYDLPSNNT